MKWSYIAHRYRGDEGSPTAKPPGFEFALGDGETARQYRFARTTSAPSSRRASRNRARGSPRLPSTKTASSWISASWRGEALASAAETSRATPATSAVRCVRGLVIECLQHGGAGGRSRGCQEADTGWLADVPPANLNRMEPAPNSLRERRSTLRRVTTEPRAVSRRRHSQDRGAPLLEHVRGWQTRYGETEPRWAERRPRVASLTGAVAWSAWVGYRCN
jgi:hypothetical protein